MRAFFLWNNFSGYASSCWHELKSLGVDCAFHCVSKRRTKSDPPFDQNLLLGLNFRLHEMDCPKLSKTISLAIAEFRPDVLIVSGWQGSAFRDALRSDYPCKPRKILCMDNPFRGDGRQFLGRIWFRSIARKLDRVAVPGERGFQLAKYFGIPERRIFKGLYGVDGKHLRPVYSNRIQSPWPKRFVFIGRYEPRKGLDILLKAFEMYTEDPNADWTLTTVGNGPLKHLIKSTRRVTDLGFCPPPQLPDILGESGAFILPSRYDAWPLSLVEAAMSGLPIIATHACGSGVELLRNGFNGYSAATGEVEDLAEKMHAVSSSYKSLPEFGLRSQQLAEPWTAQQWATRWRDQIQQLS
jgi:glycosyltransferase involved in cell wall biosynthesis